MPSKRRTPDEIVHHLRDAEVELADGKTIGQVCEKLGISEQTFHRWRNQYGGASRDALRRLREVELENVRLRRVVVTQALDNQRLRDTVTKNGLLNSEGGEPL